MPLADRCPHSLTVARFDADHMADDPREESDTEGQDSFNVVGEAPYLYDVTEPASPKVDSSTIFG